MIPRHVVGQLDVEAARTARPGAPWWQVANAVRRTLDQGAEALPTSQRALFTGLTVGDDRDQSPEVAEDFRAAGLSHLLAVSGQNVAFLLVLAGPALRQFGLGARLPVTVALLVFLALVTRFEPSVLRAP